MEAASLLSLPDGLEVAQLCIVDDVFRIDVVATAEESICPLCAEVATHVRSYYTRVVDDVPCAGHRVQLILHVRKFRCDTPTCPRKVFADRLGPFLEAWAHKTTRLRKAVEAIGLATCGKGLSRRSIPGRRRASSHCGFATSSNSRARPKCMGRCGRIRPVFLPLRNGSMPCPLHGQRQICACSNSS